LETMMAMARLDNAIQKRVIKVANICLNILLMIQCLPVNLQKLPRYYLFAEMLNSIGT
jgi:hypothetical protein